MCQGQVLLDRGAVGSLPQRAQHVWEDALSITVMTRLQSQAGPAGLAVWFNRARHTKLQLFLQSSCNVYALENECNSEVSC